jgi:hypothetical protein
VNTSKRRILFTGVFEDSTFKSPFVSDRI